MDSFTTRPQTTPKHIVGSLTVLFYILFTLLPDSSSLVMSWSWVFVWQVALLLPWLWLLRQWWLQKHPTRLGYNLDYGITLAILGLVSSTLLSPFPQQARWYSWAALCAIAALYALNAWCSITTEVKSSLYEMNYGTGLWTNGIVSVSSEWMKRHHRAAQVVEVCERTYQ
jgi:uncharacterized protein involved in response to NO